MYQRANGRSSIDRIINSPSTEFDSLDCSGLPGLADFKEDTLYPEELADDYVRLDSESCTPRSNRKLIYGSGDPSDAEHRQAAADSEGRDRITALPPPLQLHSLPQVRARGFGNGISSAENPGSLLRGYDLRKLTQLDAAARGSARSGCFMRAGTSDSTGDSRQQQQSRVTILEASSLAVESVTVYIDRAEVRRILRPHLLAGESELLIRSLSPAIDSDSIRLEVLRGPAAIADVTFAARMDPVVAASKAARRAAAADTLERQRLGLEALRSRLVRVCRQREVLSSFADLLIGSSAVARDAGPSSMAEAFDPGHLDSLIRFFDLFDRQAGRLDDEMLEVQGQIEVGEAEFSKMEQRLAAIELECRELLNREVSVILESQEAAEAELRLSYVVVRASWRPKYDIRVFSNEAAMKIHYYGLVRQETGENWENCPLSLATCQPGTGGAAPAMGVQTARFKGGGCRFESATASVSLRKSATALRQKRGQGKAFSFPAAGMMENGSDLSGVAVAAGMASRAGGRNGHAVKGCRSVGEPSLQSAQFSVARPVSIPSDGADHRVSVAIIDLCPTFEFESVPRKSPFAFLKATAANSSGYPLLPGHASVYLDNGFVSNTELQAAAPQEQLSCHLGADRGIKIAYRPMLKSRQAGQSNAASQQLHKQVIQLTNTHRRPVRVLVMEPLPVAAEDKIRVQLQEPMVRNAEKYSREKPVRINKSSNVEWDVDLAAGESKEVVLRYSIGCPAGHSLEFSVSEA